MPMPNKLKDLSKVHCIALIIYDCPAALFCCYVVFKILININP